MRIIGHVSRDFRQLTLISRSGMCSLYQAGIAIQARQPTVVLSFGQLALVRTFSNLLNQTASLG